MATAKKITPKIRRKPSKKPEQVAEAISAVIGDVNIKIDEPKKETPKKADKPKKNKGGRPRKDSITLCGKCKKPKGDGEGFCECGRKMFNGKDEDVVLAKLEAAFSIGATDQEACLQADISVDSLYYYQNKNPEFSKRKEMLKSKLVLKARSIFNNVMNEEDKNGKPSDRALTTAWKYVEKRKADEFGNTLGLITDPGDGVLTEERKAQIALAMKNWSEPEDGDERDEDYEIEYVHSSKDDNA